MSLEDNALLSFAIAMYERGPHQFRDIAQDVMWTILAQNPNPKPINPFVEGV
jgi:hypothetical protein